MKINNMHNQHKISYYETATCQLINVNICTFQRDLIHYSLRSLWVAPLKPDTYNLFHSLKLCERAMWQSVKNDDLIFMF